MTIAEVNKKCARGAVCSAAMNRCEWRLRGSVSHIMSIQVYLRCARCRSKIEVVQLHRSGAVLISRSQADQANLGTASRCSKCGSQECGPVWQMSFHIDDGSAECKATVEGDTFFAMLLSTSDKKRTGAAPCSEKNAQIIAVKTIRSYVERAVYHTGTIRAYVGNISVEDTCSLDYESEGDENEVPYHVALSHVPISADFVTEVGPKEKYSRYSTSSAPLEPNLQTMHDLLSKCQADMIKLACSIKKSSIYDFTIKQIPNPSQGSFRDVNSAFSNTSSEHRGIKNIRVQKTSANWVVENVDIPSAFPEKISMEILSVKLLAERELHALSWEIMAELKSL